MKWHDVAQSMMMDFLGGGRGLPGWLGVPHPKGQSGLSSTECCCGSWVPEPGHISPLQQLLPWAHSTGTWVAPAMEWEQMGVDVLEGQ